MSDPADKKEGEEAGETTTEGEPTTPNDKPTTPNDDAEKNDAENKDDTNEKTEDTADKDQDETVDKGPKPLVLIPYIVQKKFWPKEGNHILAQYDDDSIVVYQAYKDEIAQYAIENQQFGGDHFSFNRMSWIKTNFLWMMFRCGWASKKDQENVLAIRITRKGFDEILANASTVKQKPQSETPDDVRLQWDPDHGPNGSCERRRAVQLGLRKEILQRYATEFIISIENITEMVKENNHHATEGCIVKLQTPRERVYHVEDEEVAKRIALNKWEDIAEEEEDVW